MSRWNSYHLERTLPVHTSARTLYEALLDTPQWPEITPSMRSVTWIDPGPTVPGRRAKVIQPRLRPAVWAVTETTQDHAFVWETSMPGLKMVAGHYVDAESEDDSVKLRLTLDIAGPLTLPVTTAYGTLLRDYLDQEIGGFARTMEGAG